MSKPLDSLEWQFPNSKAIISTPDGKSALLQEFLEKLTVILAESIKLANYHTFHCHQIIPVRVKKMHNVSVAQPHHFLRSVWSKLIKVLCFEHITLMWTHSFCHTKDNISSLVGLVLSCRASFCLPISYCDGELRMVTPSGLSGISCFFLKTSK